MLIFLYRNHHISPSRMIRADAPAAGSKSSQQFAPFV